LNSYSSRKTSGSIGIPINKTGSSDYKYLGFSSRRTNWSYIDWGAYSLSVSSGRGSFSGSWIGTYRSGGITTPSTWFEDIKIKRALSSSRVYTPCFLSSFFALFSNRIIFVHAVLATFLVMAFWSTFFFSRASETRILPPLLRLSRASSLVL
jgi:hypothetical protein